MYAFTECVTVNHEVHEIDMTSHTKVPSKAPHLAAWALTNVFEDRCRVYTRLIVLLMSVLAVMIRSISLELTPSSCFVVQ